MGHSREIKTGAFVKKHSLRISQQAKNRQQELQEILRQGFFCIEIFAPISCEIF